MGADKEGGIGSTGTERNWEAQKYFQVKKGGGKLKQRAREEILPFQSGQKRGPE